MVTKLDFIQNQTKEGIEFEILDAEDNDTAVDLSEVLEITFRCFTQDYQTLMFSGSKTGGEITFLSDGTDGKIVYAPNTDDFDIVGIYRTELEIEFSDSRLGKIQDLLIQVKPESPTGT